MGLLGLSLYKKPKELQSRREQNKDNLITLSIKWSSLWASLYPLILTFQLSIKSLNLNEDHFSNLNIELPQMGFFKNHNQEMCIEIALKALPYEMQACMPRRNNMLKISRTQK
jgi:hypothetical protein